MQAVWEDTVIAEAPKENLIRIEGNWYFPASAMKEGFFMPSDHHTTCHWKGEASYYDVIVDTKTNAFGAWYYPAPKDGSIERVGNDFTNFVAFWNGIEVTE
jgi:uncharacterized protein (DUF427 family)